MATLVVLEALAIALLGVLVVGLLRSHAEILRSLHELGVEPNHEHQSPDAVPGSTSVAVGGPRPLVTSRSGRPVTGAKASDVVGTTPEKEIVHVGVVGANHDTLLAFLSSGCHTCAGLWQTLAEGSPVDLPDRTRLVVVTKDPEQESLSRIRELAPTHVPVVMSTGAWQEYGVPVTPYFVHVHGASGEVVGQGSGATWTQVLSLLRQATHDDHSGGRRPRVPSPVEEQEDVDSKLLAAGIRPGDSSLYTSPVDGT